MPFLTRLSDEFGRLTHRAVLP